MEEIWRDVVGYEGLYMVSNYGKVMSLNYCKRGYAKLLTPKVNRSGRLWVNLYKNGVNKPFLIHRLVGTAFIPNPDGLPQINHKDENPKNNHVGNLEWCDNLYNARYSFERHPERKIANLRKKYQTAYLIGDEWHGMHAKFGQPWKNGPKNKKPVVQYTKDMIETKTWKSISVVVKETGWRYSSIKECCEGKRKTAYGFKWQYAV